MLEAIADRRTQRLLAFVAVMMVIVTLGLREIANRPAAVADYPAGISGPEVTVIVETGESGEQIARELERLDVVDSWQSFFRIALTDARAGRIAPGSYRIETKIPALTALEQLLDPSRIQGLIPLRDGVRVAEVKELLRDLGYPDIEKAFESLRPPAGFEGDSIEGFLYPARYSFAPETDTREVLVAMIRRFEVAVAKFDLTQSALSPNEVITVASLIEAEGTPDVFAQIARVIFNRLEKGMPLQLDSTVHYVQGSRGEIALSLAETRLKSPYNTYQNRGLPPGPIGSPTSAAIKAALEPAEGDWTYFITVAPQDTRFTNSYDQFLEWKNLYRKNYRDGLFDD